MTNTVKLDGDELRLGPVRVSFQRTLRVPELGIQPLPPGLGRFPLRRVEDYPDTAPSEWMARGGVILPVYQREAMWLSFETAEPSALQVGVGKVCAISGEAWRETLRKRPQNYLTLPDQPWLDGINAGAGFIRQFVAVPLGSGATVEGQLTGEEVHGGVQLRAVGLTNEALGAWNRRSLIVDTMPTDVMCCAGADMGLGAGGRMRQEIYADERRLADYDHRRDWRVFVHLCSAEQWTSITGEAPPPTPVDRDTYVRCGLPWFDYYDADSADLNPSGKLANVKTVGKILDLEEAPFVSVDATSIVVLKDKATDKVAAAGW